MASKKIPVKVDLGVPTLHTKADKEISFLFEKYIELHPDEVTENGMIDPAKVVEWAISKGIFKPKPISPEEQLRRRVARHLGHRYMVDPQGRTPRALVAVPISEGEPDEHGRRRRRYGYFPLFQTEPNKVEIGLKLRLNWAYKRAEQAVVDQESYDDNNIFGAKIGQLDLNFEKRLADSKMPKEWSDTPPDGLDEDDDR